MFLRSTIPAVSRTYKNFDGYAPIFAYIETEGYLCNAELHEGEQHCQSGTPEFLSETIADELKSVCRNVTHPREGKTVYIGSTWRNFKNEKTGNPPFGRPMRSPKE